MNTASPAAPAIRFPKPKAGFDRMAPVGLRAYTVVMVAATFLLVIAGGLDRYTSLDDAERMAEWLDSEFEPFGAHSHYGLIHGESSYQQVAEAVRTFLETHRL